MLKKIMTLCFVLILALPAVVWAGDEGEVVDDYVELDSLLKVKSMGEGDLVLVYGVVSVGYDVLEEGRLWIQDDSAGLSLKFGEDPELIKGREMKVWGEIQELSYRLVLQVNDFEELGLQGVSEQDIEAEDLDLYKDRLVKFSGNYDHSVGSI